MAENRPEPRNNSRNNRVAGATDRATTRATGAQQPSLKALAQQALSRNNPRNNRATDLLRVARPRERNAQQPDPRAEVEAVLAAACRRLQLDWQRLRQHPRGVTDEDIAEFCEGWSDYNNPALLEAFCRSVAHRLMLDRMPAINERAA
jgi:protein tyrosine phosphatase (PTP) superfamily phosphohydrolase (DUF442 family)